MGTEKEKEKEVYKLQEHGGIEQKFKDYIEYQNSNGLKKNLEFSTKK